jgi:uncharacterized damage-inducible protein DinB
MDGMQHFALPMHIFSSISAILWHVFIHEVRHKAMTFNYNQILSQIEEQIAA